MTAPGPATAPEPAAAGTVGRDELRTLFLFESLTDDQLDALAEHARVRHVPGGSDAYTEGEPAAWFFVLLDGEVSLRRRVQGDDVEITRTRQRGVYGGATQAYLGEQAPPGYANTLHAVADSAFLVLPAEPFAELVRAWFPMAMHLLEGLFVGMRASEALVGQRERLIALGRLSAGLTHELNNPAAAAVRATGALRDRVAEMRTQLAHLSAKKLDRDAMHRLTELQDAAVARIATAPVLTPLQASDREDEVGTWLEDADVPGPWQVAPVLVAAGLDVAWLEEVAASVEPRVLPGAVCWIASTLESELLMGEISDAVSRISTLVGAAKQYSQMDRAPHQWFDVHEGLDSTLVMLSKKLGDGVEVVKDYDRSLPRVPGYPGELNQVWTNLIDNAAAAMQRSGVLTLRTRLDGGDVLVEVADTGPGVPPELTRRVFEPFFTTKPVGEGTGLGLDISWRIVVHRHGGDLRVVSVPGDTRFQVRLPLTERAAPAG